MQRIPSQLDLLLPLDRLAAKACPRCGILMLSGECRFCILELAGVQLVGALR
jgi:hypothetical protein